MKTKLPILLTLFICLSILIGWLMLKQLSATRKKLMKNQFEYQTDSFIFSLKERYKRNAITLEGFEGFFNSSESVSLAEWNQYVKNLNLSKTLPAIMWVAYIKKVSENEKINMIQSIQEDKDPNFNIWPKSEHPFYYPIIYLSPASYRSLIGYDFYTNPMQREVFEQSQNSTELMTISPIETNLFKSKRQERILLLPIESQKDNLPAAWIAASLDFSIIIKQTSEGIFAQNLDISVYAGENISTENLIYKQKNILQEKLDLSITKVFEFAGTQWTFVFKSSTLGKSALSAYSFYLVFFFLLIVISLALALYFYYLKKHGVLHKEDELQKQILSSTQYSIIATDTKGLITYFNTGAERLLGYKADEMIGKKTPQIFHDQEEMNKRASELSSILKKEIPGGFEVFVSLLEKEPFENRRWTYIKKDQTKVSVQLSVTALKDENQKVVGYLGIAIDVTEVKF